MNRYDGNTGRVERMPEPMSGISQLPPLFSEEEDRQFRKPSGESGILGGLGGILPKGGLGGLGGILPKGGLSGLSGLLPKSGLAGLLPKGGIGGILSKIGKLDLELEDLMLVGIFYLLYRESGDIEFLLIAGAMLFL